jgi:hypothetical protein
MHDGAARQGKERRSVEIGQLRQRQTVVEGNMEYTSKRNVERIPRSGASQSNDSRIAINSRKPDTVGIGHADDDRELVATVAAEAGTFLDDSLAGRADRHGKLLGRGKEEAARALREKARHSGRAR